MVAKTQKGPKATLNIKLKITCSHNYQWKEYHFMGCFTKVVMDGDWLYRPTLIFQESNLENINKISRLLHVWGFFFLFFFSAMTKTHGLLMPGIEFQWLARTFSISISTCKKPARPAGTASIIKRGSLHARSSHIMACTLPSYQAIFFLLHLSKPTLITHRYVWKSTGGKKTDVYVALWNALCLCWY